MTNNTAAVSAEVVINREALRHNYEYLSGLAARTGAQTMAVVKADGYGHGAAAVAEIALASGASWLGVCSVTEALALRSAGINARVLSWLNPVGTDFAPAIAEDVHLSVSSLRELNAVINGAAQADRPAKVHLKIDTGLSRNGCLPQLWPALVEEAAKAHADGKLEVVAIWSHLACADEPGHPATDAQADCFAQAYQSALAVGLQPMRHLANSAATLLRPDLHHDLVRVGIAGYGLNPVPGFAGEELRPAMTFRSTVVLTKQVTAGTSVSYGQTWSAPTDTTLALVPVGYADGVPRGLSNRMRVWLAGRSRPVVGRVCMDQIVVDCGQDTVHEGDEVLLFGPGDRGEPTAREWADTLGTIDYEIATGMNRPRVVRRYVDAP